MLNGSYNVIVGNAVDDFDLRFTPGGAAVGDVTVAVNSREQIDGEYVDRDDPMYVKVTLWWEYAENCAETIFKGTRVIAVGEMHVRKWETRDGDERLSIEMTADELGPALRWAQAKITKMGRTDRDDRDDDRDDRGGRDRGNRRGGDRGRGNDDRGGSRRQRTNDRGSRSERRGSSGRDDDRGRDDRRGGGRSSRSGRSDSRGSGKRARSAWDDDEAPVQDDPNSDLPDDPDF
jgi:single-strand DNA-binding protein